MDYEIFLDKLLELLSWPNSRLRNLNIRNQISRNLLVLYNTYIPEIHNTIKYFITIRSSYKHLWNNGKPYREFIEINKMQEYMILYQYLACNNYLYLEELEWLDDAIHEVLLE